MATAETPNVSVIVTAYNAGEWIRATLESILAQSYQDLEVIVVDDGSTDGTIGVVSECAPAAVCVRQENRGQPGARNVGIHRAKGRYVAFVDADDLWDEEKLSLQMSVFARRPDLAWVYSDARAFDSDTGLEIARVGNNAALPEGNILKALLLRSFIASPTPVIRKDVFEVVGYFDESRELRLGEDWNMWLRIAARYDVGVVQQPLAWVRQHPESMTKAMNLEEALRSRVGIVEAAVSRDPERLGGARRRALANVHTTVAESALGRGESRVFARSAFLKAALLAPLSLAAVTGLILSMMPDPVVRLAQRLRRTLRRPA